VTFAAPLSIATFIALMNVMAFVFTPLPIPLISVLPTPFQS